jgi:uncharacterized protein (DUF427 family)
MKAIWKNTTIAEAPKEALIRIEGNWYFPPSSLNQEFFKNSDHRTICHWKGEANYYTIAVEKQVNESSAWYYPHPMPGSIDRVKSDFTNYVAFWHGIEIVE